MELTLYQVLSLLGIPSLCMAVYSWYAYKLKKYATESQALKLGIQALLRSQMISDYNAWMKRGYAPIYARENFEDCWKQYHALGANGIIKDLHQKFMDLPTDKQA